MLLCLNHFILCHRNRNLIIFCVNEESRIDCSHNMKRNICINRDFVVNSIRFQKLSMLNFSGFTEICTQLNENSHAIEKIFISIPIY